MKESKKQIYHHIEKPKDWLPDGTTGEESHYVSVDNEWTSLEKRIGLQRIKEHPNFMEIIAWVKNKYKENPEDFYFFEAGCGHGNDFRAMKEEIERELKININEEHFLGVDISGKEIKRGLEYYKEKKDENTEQARKLFAQGNLCDLNHINKWDNEKEDFSQEMSIKDKQFDLLYMEAVLHGLGHGKKTYQEKKEAAQLLFNELYRICKEGGRFFGRVNTFDSDVISKDEQFTLMREADNWRFIPGKEEFEEMLQKAGFKLQKKDLKSNEIKHYAATDQNNQVKQNVLKYSFLAEK